MKAYPARHPGIVAEDFPGYAPEADPDEGVWGWIECHRRPNNAPEDAAELRFRLCRELSVLRRRPELLASFIRHAGFRSGCKRCRLGKAGVSSSDPPALSLSWLKTVDPSVRPVRFQDTGIFLDTRQGCVPLR